GAPPSSTLVPYTTLFRSRPFAGQSVAQIDDAEAAVQRDDIDHAPCQRCESRHEPIAYACCVELARGIVGRRQQQAQRQARLQRTDRKSTRLNSSHVKISY